MALGYTVLYAYSAGDPVLWRNGEGRYVASPSTGWWWKNTAREHKGRTKPWNDPCMRMRGFVLTVDGRYKWDADPPELLWLGRWLGAYEQTMFKRPYLTTRRHGFAIFFQRQDDAEGFQLQCLDNPSALTGHDPLMRSYVPKKRPANQQLPFNQNRMDSDCFSAEIKSYLWVRQESPLEPHRFMWCSLDQIDYAYSSYSTQKIWWP